VAVLATDMRGSHLCHNNLPWTLFFVFVSFHFFIDWRTAKGKRQLAEDYTAGAWADNPAQSKLQGNSADRIESN
jgi:hypothetical protein